MERVRRPAVAGSFYPRQAEVLSAEVDRLLGEARVNTRAPAERLRALIAPHAGYVYSGPVAASAYTALEPLANSIRRVVLLGPSHFVPFVGLALPDADAFETPLGRIPLDTSAMERLRAMPQVRVDALAHAREHSLEVHLAFLQRVVPEFRLVPLAVGHARPRDVAEVLDAVVDDGTFVLVSSDLSHYLSYGEARRIDRATADHIVALEPVAPDTACGAAPVNGLLAWARATGLRATLLDLRSSGDTAGGLDQVVGYGSFAFTESGGARS